MFPDFLAHPIIFAIFWLLSFLLHEWCHSLEMWCQCGRWGSIHMSWSGMWVTQHHNCFLRDGQLVDFAGGVYTSMVLFLLACVSTGFFSFCFLSLGWLQLIYGLMEGFLLKSYRFVWYAFFLVVVFFLWIWWFVI